MKYLLSILLLSQVTYASDEDNVHFAAHVGTSFAIDTVAYGVKH